MVCIYNIIFEKNRELIHDGGGTQKLALFVKIEYGSDKFVETITNTNAEHNSVITKEMLKKAFVRMQSQINTNDKETLPYPQLYT